MKQAEENRKRHPASGRRFPWQLNKYSGQATDASGGESRPLLGETQKPDTIEVQACGVPQVLPSAPLAVSHCFHVMGRRMVDCPRCVGWMVEYAVMVDALWREDDRGDHTG